MNDKKPSVKSKVEAVLFSAGHKIKLDDICKLCRSRKEDVLQALNELQKEYDEKQSSLMLVDEGEHWKFTIRDHLISVVRKIVTETELKKTVLETLAVIAFKYPILQADLIKLRTNKAYDHLVELESAGYITRQKHSRTNLIKLTDKFFKYFDLTEEKLRDQFKDFHSIAKAIKEKEEEVDKIKEDQIKKAEELKQQDEKIKKEIESLDKAGEEFAVPLETYSARSSDTVSQEYVAEGNLVLEKEKMGNLDVIEDQKAEPEKHEKHKHGHHEHKEQHKQPEIKAPVQQQTAQPAPQAVQVVKQDVPAPSVKQDIWQEPQKAAEQQSSEPKEQEEQPEEKKTKGIKVTPEMEAKINQKVEELLHGKEKKEQ